MKVCGFSFIRNAIRYDYPIVEAIRSILPICDAFVVAVGNSDDATLELIQKIDSDKIEIIETVWDDSLREGGKVLAVETNKAFAAIPPQFDWAFYIQGDEVVHEQYLPIIQEAMTKYKDREDVDGLLFNYLHFFGSYDYVGQSSRWYNREIRVIKNNKDIFSYKDAQGFRKNENKKLRVIAINAWVYHYGWIREPKAMQQKLQSFHKLWHDDQWVEKHVQKSEEFDYEANMTELRHFKGSHPKLMQARIERKNWSFDADLSMQKSSLKDILKKLALDYLGWNTNYRNYKIVK